MDRNSIVALPDPRLRQKSDSIKKITPALRKLVKDMQKATLDWEDHREHELAVALAAVQVGELKRVVIVRSDFENKDDRTFQTLINPRITKREGRRTPRLEGCLSVTDVYGRVPRYPRVTVEAEDLQGKAFQIKASDFLAQVLQHEIDHTNGIVFVDHIKDEDAFYKLDREGKLIKQDYDTVKKSRILW